MTERAHALLLCCSIFLALTWKWLRSSLCPTVVSVSAIDVRMGTLCLPAFAAQSYEVCIIGRIVLFWACFSGDRISSCFGGKLFLARVALLNFMEGKKYSSQSITAMEAHAPASLWDDSQYGAADLEAGKATLQVLLRGTRQARELQVDQIKNALEGDAEHCSNIGWCIDCGLVKGDDSSLFL
jgi:hypothetical protein